MAEHQKLEWLEALRGAAAIWVLVHHAHLATTGFVAWDRSAAGNLISNGFLGVDFFFVLSGFIIAFASQRLSDRGGGARQYLQSRLLRIYVPYLPIGIGIYLLYLLLPGVSQAERTPGLLTSMTLVPSNAPPALSVAWTLVHEMIFYTIYSLWFVSRRLLWGVLALWACAIAVLWLLDSELSRITRYFFSPLNLCFLLGIVMYRLSRWRRLGGLATTVLALVGGALVVVQAWQPEPVRLWVALGFAAIVFAAAMPSAARMRLWQPLIVLGAASYAIYLVHDPVLSVAVRAAARIGLTGWGAFLAISVVALAAGVVYLAVYERSALRWVRQLLARSGSLPTPAAVRSQ